VAVTLANEGGATKTTVTTTDAVKDALVTIIDLTDGDVVNVISPSLKDDEGLRAFHTAQVEKSLTVLPENLRAMFDLGKVLYNELQ
jgi:hypothetical protein